MPAVRLMKSFWNGNMPRVEALVATSKPLLREFALVDVDALYALESIPDVVRYQSYGPKTRVEAADYVAKTVAAQSETPRRHIEMAVIHEGAFVGRVGAWVEGGEASLWYAFFPWAQGRGLATAAMRVFIPQLDVERLTIECDPRNAPSCRLAKRLGFMRESLTERAYECKGEWVGSVVYRAPLRAGNVAGA